MNDCKNGRFIELYGLLFLMIIRFCNYYKIEGMKKKSLKKKYYTN